MLIYEIPGRLSGKDIRFRKETHLYPLLDGVRFSFSLFGLKFLGITIPFLSLIHHSSSTIIHFLLSVFSSSNSSSSSALMHYSLSCALLPSSTAPN